MAGGDPRRLAGVDGNEQTCPSSIDGSVSTIAPPACIPPSAAVTIQVPGVLGQGEGQKLPDWGSAGIHDGRVNRAAVASVEGRPEGAACRRAGPGGQDRAGPAQAGPMGAHPPTESGRDGSSIKAWVRRIHPPLSRAHAPLPAPARGRCPASPAQPDRDETSPGDVTVRLSPPSPPALLGTHKSQPECGEIPS